MNFRQLIGLVETLRGPRGCPWDREQTRHTLKPFLLEEAYELLEALDEDDPEKIREELGDLLFQVVFHCRISEEMKQFGTDDVLQGIIEKMVKRHPHVFGSDDIGTADEVSSRWDEHKMKEKNKGSVLDGVPEALPALLKAHRLQERASRIGFDWERIDDIFKKVEEEIRELKAALDSGDRSAIEEEMGDILFVLARVSGFVGVNPEDALRRTTGKFTQRFRHMEMRASSQGRKLQDMTLEDMDVLWEEAKKKRSQDLPG